MFDVVIYLLILLVAFSFAAIKSYLTKRGLVKFRLVYCNPVSFFSAYINDTLKNEGKIGIWFWVFISSFCALLFAGLIDLVVTVCNKLGS
jgi:hypothetical protein